MATVEAFNTGLTEEQINTAFSRALGDYTDAQIDAKITLLNTIITTIQNSLQVYLLESDNEDNPTSDTPTACPGIVLELATGEDVDVGFRLFAGTSGEGFASAKQSENTWHSWTELISFQ